MSHRCGARVLVGLLVASIWMGWAADRGAAQVLAALFADGFESGDLSAWGLKERFDLGLALTDSVDPVFPGGSLTYTLEVTNLSSSTGTLVTTSNPLPPELILLSAVPTQGSCSQTSHVVCDLGTLAGGATATITVSTAVANSASGAITNGATVTANEPENDLTNNEAIEVTTVSSSFRSPATPPEADRGAGQSSPSLLTFRLSDVSIEGNGLDRARQ